MGPAIRKAPRACSRDNSRWKLFPKAASRKASQLFTMARTWTCQPISGVGWRSINRCSSWTESTPRSVFTSFIPNLQGGGTFEKSKPAGRRERVMHVCDVLLQHPSCLRILPFQSSRLIQYLPCGKSPSLLSLLNALELLRSGGMLSFRLLAFPPLSPRARYSTGALQSFMVPPCNHTSCSGSFSKNTAQNRSPRTWAYRFL